MQLPSMLQAESLTRLLREHPALFALLAQRLAPLARVPVNNG